MTDMETGKRSSIFNRMAQVLRDNYGKELSRDEVLCGEPRNTKSRSYTYLTILIKLGYLELIGGEFTTDPNVRYKVARELPEHFTSSALEKEARRQRGYLI